MFSKPRKSDNHKRLEILKQRSILSMEQQNSLNRMATGYVGECHLYQLLERELHCEPIQLFDLLLDVNTSECQMDCLLIFQNECLLIEVKHFQGDFYIENNQWYKQSKEEIKNPLYQLQRTELLLKQFFRQNQIYLNIKPFIVFTHPEFQLYQAPLNIPAIFPTQLPRFIRKLQSIPCHIHHSHQQIVKKLTSKHLLTSKYETMPIYHFSELKKGVTCSRCNGFMELYERNFMKCLLCSDIAPLDESIMQNIYDFYTLFPDRKITLQSASEWMDYPISRFRMKKILFNHCKYINMGKSSHYLLNNDESL